ncbi:MAG: hypothetical protein MUC95_04510 [Spirochaetes bacterium]|jgi:hypothetical protein|nr:hypothetical protein [Spirochaetota bacterium]
MAGGNKNDDFDIGSFSIGDDELENLFEDTKKVKEGLHKEIDTSLPSGNDKKAAVTKTIPPQAKKRTAQDFEPDMDAIFLSAQSSMIIDGMKYFTNKDFSPETLPVYIEALKGVELYIKILNRNPANYKKLKSLVDADMDCQQVEKIAFNLYKNTYDDIAETDREKIIAFEVLYRLIKESVNKATIAKSIQTLKKYHLISGEINREKVQQLFKSGDATLKSDIKNLNEHIKIALEMLKKGKTEIAVGMKGRDINFYIVNASALLSTVYGMHGNRKVAEYYDRINNIHSKYFIIQE